MDHGVILKPGKKPSSDTPSLPQEPTSLDPAAIPGQPDTTPQTLQGNAPNLNAPVTVDTASLNAFGRFVGDDLQEPLRKLIPRLQAVQVEPGAFYYADQIRTYINGTSPTTGLAPGFVTTLNHLMDGLDGIQQGVAAMSRKYATVEDLNKASSDDVAADFGHASSYFGSLTGSTPGTSSSSSSSSS